MKLVLSKSQIATIVVAIFLVVLILLLPNIPKEVKSELKAVPNSSVDYNIDEVMEEYSANLSEGRKKKIRFLENELANAANNESKLIWVDSLAFYWRLYRIPEVEAVYLMKFAELSNVPKDWFVAGDAYFNIFRTADEQLKKIMINNTVECYNQILEIEPTNLNARNAIGVCYVEGAAYLGETPMKGIGMILDVLKDDPENIDALVNLGYFAIKSGQYDKAIGRYHQVLEIDSNHIEAYLYLTDIYVTTGENDKAVETLEKYKQYVKDQSKVVQIENYIEEIKKSN